LNAIVSEVRAEDGSATVKAQLRLRELIVSGALPPGERLAELALVEKLGVSRTPVRAALQRLAEEGLLDAIPGGGWSVKAFSEADVRDAIELRGTLEGLAARLAAERGAPAGLMAQARQCLERIDAVLAAPTLDAVAFSTYSSENLRFHALLAQMTGSGVVMRQIERVLAQPFASPSGFVMVHADSAQARDHLVIAQHQHRAVLQAIEQREGARAEALMREHAHLARANLAQALAQRDGLARLPGAALIQGLGVRG
jgi:GntR family transcriptional regulator, vanillate catabolism transcriptional regulator